MKLTTDEKLDRILEILEALGTRKAGPKPAKVDGQDLTRERVETLETIFWKIVNAPRKKKRDIYRVPALLIEGRNEPRIEAVVASVLCNQASLRKVFTLIGVGDTQKETPLDRARRALAQSNLLVRAQSQIRGGSYGKETAIALSPGEAIRLTQERLDNHTPKGWTTGARAEGFDDIDGRVDAPEDPCGQRVWSSDVIEAASEINEPGHLAEPVLSERKHPRVVFTLGNQAVAED
jgi:hypothetical protein